MRFFMKKKMYQTMSPDERKKMVVEFLNAAENGNMDTMVECINSGVDIEARTNDGRTALHYASGNGHLEMVQYLIDTCHVDREAKSNMGWTALHWAISYDRLEMLQYLIGLYQIDTDAVGIHGWTPLHWASTFGRLGIVQHLVEICQVNTELTDTEGRTAYDLALQFKKSNVTQYLEKARTDSLTMKVGVTESLKSFTMGNDSQASSFSIGMDRQV
jgi:ankyrin repeat protein